MSVPDVWATNDALTLTKMNNPTGRLAGGAASKRIGFPGALFSDFTTVGNVGSGEDTLKSLTIDASVLDTDGQSLAFDWNGNFAANANNKRLRIKWNGTTVLDTTALAINNGSYYASVRVFRVSSSSARVSGFVIHTPAGGGTAVPLLIPATSVSTTFTGSVVFLVTGEATADNDITARDLHCMWRHQS